MLIGDVAMKDGKPSVHGIAVISKKDGAAHGGLLLEAHNNRGHLTCRKQQSSVTGTGASKRLFGDPKIRPPRWLKPRCAGLHAVLPGKNGWPFL